jgi:hypothetical protein
MITSGAEADDACYALLNANVKIIENNIRAALGVTRLAQRAESGLSAAKQKRGIKCLVSARYSTRSELL